MGLQKRCHPRPRAEKLRWCYTCEDQKLYHKIQGKWWCTGCWMSDRPTGKKTKNARARG